MSHCSRLFAAVLWFAFVSAAMADQRLAVDQLLQQVREGSVADAKTNADRVAAFKRARDAQARLLAEVKEARQRAEARSVDLEQQFEANDVLLAEQEAKLSQRLGGLKEVFGVLQQFSGDARTQFETSPTQIQYPQRIEFLDELIEKLGRTTRLASTDDIERLWFELQREIVASGRVERFPTEVVDPAGGGDTRTVTRIGVFNLISAGEYLEHVPETGKVVVYPRQPDQVTGLLTEFEGASEGKLRPVALDPTRGQLLGLLVDRPDLRERIEQGGVIGYVILALGAIALLIALERMLRLQWLGTQVRRQLAQPDEPGENPLGRVLAIYKENRELDTESLEFRLSEAILHELPGINRRQTALKVIAMVAPLLGLLGTVVGMILTFQAITLFGTGDPKLMAGGISTALVTTVMGLGVAIPTVLLHALVASRARVITHLLEEQAMGLVAEHAEAEAR